jgi:MFS family permease
MAALRARASVDTRSPSYKWLVLSNTTLAVLLATLDGSITIIAMPDIFRGIKLDPLQSSNSFYLLWMVLGYLIVSSVLIVSLGRLGDMFGRVRIYNIGFIIYTVASLALAIDWMSGQAGALYLVVLRLVQGVGGAFLLANSAPILADAFPANQRGMALGINNIVGVSGMFIGLVVGGVLAPIDWRLVFLISVPVGLFGTVWAYLKLQELSTPHRARVDWLGNVTFAVGLILIMISITYGIRPYGHHATGWTSPRVLALLGAGLASLIAFVWIESRQADPMFRLRLLRIRAFSFGTLSTFLAGVSRGGLMFMLIIWLQGIWLPQHGVDFTQTPLLAGLYMLPLTVGMLLSGPTFGYLSDRYGARLFATGGMVLTAFCFVGLWLLPTNFNYLIFAAILLVMGVAFGMFASPNRAAVINSLPLADRGAGSGMNQTFQNSAQVLSVGVFFSLMIVGLSSSLPHTLSAGLAAHGVSAAKAAQIGHTPAVSVLFAAFLGYNPIQHLVGGHVLGALAVHNRAALTGRAFFPTLISGPFRTGLQTAFAFAIVSCLVAAAASLMRGGRYVDAGGAAARTDGPARAGDPARVEALAAVEAAAAGAEAATVRGGGGAASALRPRAGRAARR